MRIVLICGDRNWKDFEKVYKTLEKENDKIPIDFVIQGGASGVDEFGEKSATLLGITPVTCHALWGFHGKRAGPIRNKRQLDLAIKLVYRPGEWQEQLSRNLLVLAFHSDLKNSKGTKDMVNRARKAGVKVKVIK